MNQTAMQKARNSFLKKHYLNEASLGVLNNAEDLSSLLIEVKDCNSKERGVFMYNKENDEFSLLEPDNFMARRLPCNNMGECFKYDTCLLRIAKETEHPFERFLKLCIEDIYQIIKITIK